MGMGKGVQLRGAILTWLCVAACGGAAPVVETTPAPRERIAASEEPEPGWVGRPIFGFGGVSRVSGSPDGAMQLMLDGMRVEVDGDELRWADSISFDPMYCGTHVDGRYYFSTIGGAIYTADSFLGSLSLLREGGPDLTGCLVRHGVHSVKGGPGDLLLVGPGEQVRRLPEAMRGRVIDAGFRSPTLGIVVVAPGTAMLTRDGETFSPVDVGGRVVMESWPEEERWVLVTEDGAFAVDDDGEASALEGEFEPVYPRVSEELEARIKQTIIAMEPLLWSDFGPGPGGQTVVIRYEEHEDGDRPATPLYVWTPEAGLEAVPPLDSGLEECWIGDWGGKPLARCRNGVAFHANGEWRTLTDFVGGTVVAAMDGSSLAMMGGCVPEVAPELRDRTLCVHDGERWRSRELEEPVGLVDVHGDQVLVREYRGSERRVLSMADPEADRSVELGDGFRGWFVRFDADGGLWGVARSAEGLVGLRGDPGEPVVPLVTPAGLRHFRMIDRRRGMALGESLAEVFVTEDGGEHWEPLGLAVEGDASEAPIPAGQSSRPSSFLVCGASGCVAGHAFAWGSAAAMAAAGPAKPLVVTPAAVPSWDRWHSAGSTRAEVRCPRLPRDDGPSMGPTQGVGSMGEVSFDAAADEPRIRWAFHEGGRPFEASTGRLSDDARTALRNNVATLDPLYLTGRFAIVDWCALPMDSEVPDPEPVCGSPHVLRDDASPEPLALDVPEGFRPFLAGALPVAGGKTALRFVHQGRRGPRYDIVAVLGRDGAVERRRIYATPKSSFARMLATRGRDVGLALGAPGVSTLTFHSVDAAREPALLEAYPDGPVPVCRRSPGRTGTVALDDGSLGIRLCLGQGDMGPPPGGQHLPIVALDGADTCLAGFAPRPPRRWAQEFVDDPDPWLDVTIRRGTLRVRAVPREGAAGDPLECEAPAAP